MAEIVVADAGPLIAFGRLRKLELLPRLFHKVIVPRAVFQETQVRPELADARAILAAERSGVFVVDDSTPKLEILPPEADLGEGETAAIALAAAHGHGVLIDEKQGRAVAVMLHLKVIGTVGVLLIARQHGLIPALKPLLEELSASGHHLSPELVEAALRKVGE